MNSLRYAFRHVPAGLAGRVVLITGASSGIGAATARLCAAQGARAVLLARRADRLYRLASELGAAGTLVQPCDVCCREQVKEAVQAAMRYFGRIDAVVNNAGKGLYAPVAEMDLDAWHDLWTLNVTGALHVIQESVPVLQPGSVFVNVASIAARITAPHMGGYSASKAALAALSDALRLEVHTRGIRVVTVYPGSTDTEFRSAAGGADTASRRRIVRVKPERVAQVIVQAMLSHRSRVWVTWQDRLAAALGQFLPGLSDRLLRRLLLADDTRRKRL